MIDATFLLRYYARKRLPQLQAENAPLAQEAVLGQLLKFAAGTRFGRDHGFAEITTVEEYRARVRLRRYEDFWAEYWQESFPRLYDVTWPGMIRYFCVTSGTTTGVTKYIPCSDKMVAANVRAATDVLVHHIANRPRSKIMSGRNLMLGGSTALKAHAPKVHSGDLSGIAAANVPWWARRRYFPPRDVALLADWEEKVERMARLAVRAKITSISGTPSWLLLFLDRVAELKGGTTRLAEIWPELEMITHGGVHFGPYRTRFAELLEGSHAETREAYAASEGFIAAQDRGSGEGLRLVVDNGLFYEFVPVEELNSPNPTRHWIADAELDVNYALVLSSCAGAWSYVVGDTVKLISRDPPRLLVTGRTTYSLSAFGEHLIDAEIEESIAAAAAEIGESVVDYSVGPVFSATPGEKGSHLFIVEFGRAVANRARLDRFAARLDAALSETNEDYAAHRAGGFGLDAPQVMEIAPGSFAEWMKRRGRLGGQYKVPRIINDAALLADLRAFAETAKTT
jgi:GH3 auxin-responsive promoter